MYIYANMISIFYTPNEVCIQNNVLVEEKYLLCSCYEGTFYSKDGSL